MFSAGVVQTQSPPASPILWVPAFTRELSGIHVSVLYKAPGSSIQVLWSDSHQVLVIVMGWSSDLQLSSFQWKSQHCKFTGLWKTLSSPSQRSPWAPGCCSQAIPFQNSPNFAPVMLLSLRACGWELMHHTEHGLSSHIPSLWNEGTAQHCLCGEQPFLEQLAGAARC